MSYKRMPPEPTERLVETFDVEFFDGIDESNRREFVRAVSRADGLIGAGPRIAPEMLDGARSLKAISTISVGYDAFDLDYLTQHGIVLMNTPDVLTETTADLAFALILAVARRVVELAGFVRDGRWTHGVDERRFGVDVHGKTIGVVGLGRIGTAVARRAAKGFAMDVLYYSRSRRPAAERDLAARPSDLGSLLDRADVVCVTLPLTPDTEGLIGEAELRRMKRTAILINVARGGVVDEHALIAALADGAIRGAGLDVFATEPLPADSKLLVLPNVIALPHVGSATVETRAAMAHCAVDNLIDFFDGGHPRNAVNAV